MKNKKDTKKNEIGPPRLSKKQFALAVAIAERHELNIPTDTFEDFTFGKSFIDLFAFDPDSDDLTGFRRVKVIEDYLYLDKDQSHLQFKLELSREEVAFMVKVLAVYKYDGALPRENLSDPDPEGTSFKKLEEKLYNSVM
jgi:hypothetical protein